LLSHLNETGKAPALALALRSLGLEGVVLEHIPENGQLLPSYRTFTVTNIFQHMQAVFQTILENVAN